MTAREPLIVDGGGRVERLMRQHSKFTVGRFRHRANASFGRRVIASKNRRNLSLFQYGLRFTVDLITHFGAAFIDLGQCFFHGGSKLALGPKASRILVLLGRKVAR